jgi:hypothetical protein
LHRSIALPQPNVKPRTRRVATSGSVTNITSSTEFAARTAWAYLIVRLRTPALPVAYSVADRVPAAAETAQGLDLLVSNTARPALIPAPCCRLRLPVPRPPVTAPASHRSPSPSAASHSPARAASASPPELPGIPAEAPAPHLPDRAPAGTSPCARRRGFPSRTDAPHSVPPTRRTRHTAAPPTPTLPPPPLAAPAWQTRRTPPGRRSAPPSHRHATPAGAATPPTRTPPGIRSTPARQTLRTPLGSFPADIPAAALAFGLTEVRKRLSCQIFRIIY